jgi:hypothetical protein
MVVTSAGISDKMTAPCDKVSLAVRASNGISTLTQDGIEFAAVAKCVCCLALLRSRSKAVTTKRNDRSLWYESGNQSLFDKEQTVKHELPDLPYAKTALAPHISPETLEYHHDSFQLHRMPRVRQGK